MLRPVSVPAIRQIQSSVLSRCRRKLQPSSEILQTLPDLYEMYENSNVVYQQPNVCYYRLPVITSSIRHYSTMKTTDAYQYEMFDRSLESDLLQDDTKDCDRDIILLRFRTLVDMWRRAGLFVPESITDEQIEKLSNIDSTVARKRYLRTLARIENSRKLEQLRENEANASHETENRILLDMTSKDMSDMEMWNLVRGMRFEPNLVLDFDYEDYLTENEIEIAVRQLTNILSAMKSHYEPFHMHWTNLNPSGSYNSELQRVFDIDMDRIIIDISHKSFMDLFPKDKLVYLSADSPNVLTHYDPNMVYVIGVMGDCGRKPGISFSKSKRFDIASARLPLDQHIKWSQGGKNLTIDQMVKIMLELKKTNNWNKALQHVPRRKIERFYDLMQTNKPSNIPQIMDSPIGKFAFSRASRIVTDNNGEIDSKQHAIWYGRNPHPGEQASFIARRRGVSWNDTILPNFYERLARNELKTAGQSEGKRKKRRSYLKDLLE